MTERQAPTFYTATYIEAVPSAASQAEACVLAHARRAHHNTGIAPLALLRRQERPSHLVLLGGWRDSEAYARYTASPELAELAEALDPLLAAPCDTRQHTGLAVTAVAPAPADALWVVTHVDVVPPEKDNAVAALTGLAERSRTHTGNVQFEVWQQTNRPNHFTVVEVWATRTSLDGHISAPDTREFRNRLAAMTGALYDDRWYAALH